MIRGSFTRFPHTFKVFRNDGMYQVPPINDRRLILEGSCNLQVVSTAGGISNEKEAMLYDYVLFHNEDITENILVEDEMECIVGDGMIVTGIVKKSYTGQISKRIWMVEVSDRSAEDSLLYLLVDTEGDILLDQLDNTIRSN